MTEAVRSALVHRPHPAHIWFCNTDSNPYWDRLVLGLGLRLAQTAHMHVHKGSQLLSAIFDHV